MSLWDEIKAEAKQAGVPPSTVEKDYVISVVLRTLSLGFEGVVASVGTDGMDGNSPYAGAIADGHTLKIAEEKGLDMGKFLKNSDSSSFFEKTGGAILIGHTGTNVADVIVVMKR